MSALEKIKTAFEADAAKRHASGLPRKQAEVLALFQVIRDARNGELDEEATREFIIAQEVVNGSTREAAELVAVAALAGKMVTFVKRDYGYAQGKTRRRWPDNNDPSAESLAMSDQLSMWANQTLLASPK
jgi:hypothetical protein